MIYCDDLALYAPKSLGSTPIVGMVVEMPQAGSAALGTPFQITVMFATGYFLAVTGYNCCRRQGVGADGLPRPGNGTPGPEPALLDSFATGF